MTIPLHRLFLKEREALSQEEQIRPKSLAHDKVLTHGRMLVIYIDGDCLINLSGLLASRGMRFAQQFHN